MSTRPTNDDHDLERILEAARRHGEESEPDHEVGDLIEVLRAMWPHVQASDRHAFMTSALVVDLLRDWGGEDG